MDKKTIKNYQIFSLIFTFILGTLLHFTYDLSGGNSFIAAFSAVNESVWEHLKLLFFPMLLTTLFGYIKFKNTIPNFICSKTIGILASMICLTIFFYTYTGILGKNVALIDIGSFFVFASLGEFISYLLIINGFNCNKKLAIITLILLTSMFIIFTYFPPDLGIFVDPLNAKCALSIFYYKL